MNKALRKAEKAKRDGDGDGDGSASKRRRKERRRNEGSSSEDDTVVRTKLVRARELVSHVGDGVSKQDVLHSHQRRS